MKETDAMTEVAICPDCERPKANTWREVNSLTHCDDRGDPRCMWAQLHKAENEVDRLRAALAQALAPGGELETAERAYLDAAYAAVDSPKLFLATTDPAINKAANLWYELLALRAKAGR
jgi:hypothetical protein